MTTTTRNKITDWIEENYADESVLLMDGFDEAFIGIGYQQHNGPLAVYDRAACVEVLMEMFKDGEDPHELAEEYFQYNTEGAWVGENTPIIIDRLS